MATEEHMAKTKASIKQGLSGEVLNLLKRIYADQLGSVIVYGSFVKESFTPGSSDVNLLIVLSKSEENRIRSIGREGYSLFKRYNITPLILSETEFKNSADVFPMEYLDLQENHEVLYGRDVTGDLVIGKENLRHEVEHQLRGSLVSLRQLAIAADRKRPFWKGAVRRELQRWYGSLAAILRGVLRLKADATAPQDHRELVSEVNRALGLEAGPIIALLDCRTGDCPEVTDLIDSLLERLARLVEIVDQMEGGS
jgi:predicted nucleotidyltransferase